MPNSAGKHTFFRCCLVIADHNSYHIGELAIGRQTAGFWPKGRRDWRDDALALLLAWGSPELDVLALTVVAGNAAGR